MNQIGFDAEMIKYIFKAIDNFDSLKLKYLSSLAYSKLINNDTAL